ncbi:MAG: cation transporter [Candidatus Riflebacteria bacterium HGW-Riflebacteria-1]|nr:MAG: cation transporter [Candidatus Riflebacteria bacterium HGW-Riflebacteria-1]
MREKEYLLQRYTAILSLIGAVLIMSGAMMLTPLVLIITRPEEMADAWAFILPALLQMLSGALLRKQFSSTEAETLTIQEGGIVVLVSWLIVILFTTWPFISVAGLSFSQAFFEAMSGWTTTGLSVVNVTTASPIILLWRSIIQLAGGAGWAIIMMSTLAGPTGVAVSGAEGRSEQIAPHVRQSARLVMLIYVCYAAAGSLAYWLAGMSSFDAVNHSFAAVSTGGFSTRVESIGYWNSTVIEAITLPLMVFGNLSFVTAWYFWRGKFSVVAKNGEVRLSTVLMPIAVLGVFILTCQALYPQLEKAVRVAIFETVSAMTTTGFSTVTYENWNSSGVFLLVILMLIGGGSCSTAGGIKQFRIYLLWKTLIWDIQRLIMPKNAVIKCTIWEGDQCTFLNDARVRQTTVFVFIYLLTFALGVLLLCSYGYSLRDSLFEFASALGTVGLSIGLTSPDMPAMVLYAQALAMFLGRLEFIIVFTSIIKLAKDAYTIKTRQA